MLLGTDFCTTAFQQGLRTWGRLGSQRAFACQYFFTCFYTILDPETGRLNYTKAGHDLPYLCRSGEAQK